MAGYDGSIRIDTSIDTKGFNAGTKEMSSAVSSIGAAISGAFEAVIAAIGTVVVVIGVVIALVIFLGICLVAAFTTALVAVINWGKQVIDAMSQAVSRTTQYEKDIASVESLFHDIEGAAYAAFAPLFYAALPWIKLIVNWLVQALNTAAMILAVLLGQSTVMQYVAGSADDAAGSTGRLADETSRAGKAAKGALASFDQINVLQQDSASQGAGMGMGALKGGNMKMIEVAVDPDILAKTWESIKKWASDTWEWIKKTAKEKWDETWELIKANVILWWETIKARAAEAWENIKIKAQEIWDWIKTNIWQPIADWFKTNVSDPLSKWWAEAWDKIKTKAGEIWDEIKLKWEEAKTWFQINIIDPVTLAWNNFWTYIGIWASDAWLIITLIWAWLCAWFQLNVIDPLVEIWNNFWEQVSFWAQFAWIMLCLYWSLVAWWFDKNVITPTLKLFTDLWEGIKKIWTIVSTWFSEHVIEPLKAAWKTMLEWLGEKWSLIFEGIKAAIKGKINDIIGFINGMIRGVVSAINGIAGAFNKAFGSVPGWKNIPEVGAPQIPLLATGAVIPANSQFLAVLGDQKTGRNIESPESLLRQIVREESGGKNPQDIVIRFENDNLGALWSLLQPVAERENSRIGISLISGATA